VPEGQRGPNSLENAAPLCASCHDLYGGNPEKRKALVQMRDHWWDLIKERHCLLTDPSELSPPFEIPEDPHAASGLRNSKVVSYHLVFAEENFEESAATILKLVSEAQEAWPNYPRRIYLDIEGHRNTPR
jgi:hypothetical protein